MKDNWMKRTWNKLFHPEDKIPIPPPEPVKRSHHKQVAPDDPSIVGTHANVTKKLAEMAPPRSHHKKEK